MGDDSKRFRRELPEDLIVKILSRLPAKSLVRFRCVCKGWNILIHSPKFVDAHFNSYNQDDRKRGSIFRRVNGYGGAIFSLRVNEETTDLNLPLPAFKNDVDIVGSSKGLVCLKNSGDYALWNPAIREFRLLSEPKAKLALGGIFESQGSGFVFDLKSEDYKVVRIKIWNDYGRYIAQIDVYRWRSNSWKSLLQNLPSEVVKISSSRPVFVHGCCYWLVDVLSREERNQGCVLCYDIGEGNFRELIQMPSDLKEGFETSLDVSTDTLALFAHKVTYNYPHETSQFDVWVMNEHGGVYYCWSKRLSVGPLEMNAVPYRFWMKDGVELVVFRTQNEASSNLNLFTFHPVTGKIEKFLGNCLLECCSYYECLVPV